MKNARLLAEQNQIIDQFNKRDRRLIDARSLAELGRWVADLLDVTADETNLRKGADLAKVEGLRAQADGYRQAAEALAPNGPSWEEVAVGW